LELWIWKNLKTWRPGTLETWTTEALKIWKPVIPARTP
jgi:hypothetical protein